MGHPDPWALRYYGLGDRRIWRTGLHSTVRMRIWADGAFEVETAAVEIPARGRKGRPEMVPQH